MNSKAWFEKDGPVAGVWNSIWAGGVLWLFGTGLLLYWRTQTPAPGVAIGALAVVAGIMSVRDMKVLGKVAQWRSRT